MFLPKLVRSHNVENDLFTDFILWFLTVHCFVVYVGLHDKAVSDYEKTKRLLQYLDEVVGSSPGISVAASINLHGETSPLSIAGPGIVLSAGTVTKDHKEVAPTEIHEASGPLLSARRRFYQQRASEYVKRSHLSSHEV